MQYPIVIADLIILHHPLDLIAFVIVCASGIAGGTILLAVACARGFDAVMHHAGYYARRARRRRYAQRRFRFLRDY